MLIKISFGVLSHNLSNNNALLPLQEIEQFFDVVWQETGITLPIPGKKHIFHTDLHGFGPIEFLAISSNHDIYKELTNNVNSNTQPSSDKAESKERSKIAKREKNERKREDLYQGWQEQLQTLSNWISHRVKKRYVCVDVESYERAHNIVTEVGIAVFIVTQEDEGRKITTKHFRVRENINYRNGNFVSDAADRFEFGLTEIVSLRDLPGLIAACFKTPGSMDADDVILVGHDVKTDIAYMQQVGFDVTNLKQLVVIDTANLWKGIHKVTESASLGRMCDELGIDAWNLHNAGQYISITKCGY